jgi:hypothetical protein
MSDHDHDPDGVDLLAVLGPDLAFVCERVKGLRAAEVEKAYFDAHIALLEERKDIELSGFMRDMIASQLKTLKALLWPDRKRRGRPAVVHEQRFAEMRAGIRRAELEAAFAHYKKLGIQRSEQEVWKEVANSFGHSSVEALRQFLKPSRVRRQKPGPK